MEKNDISERYDSDNDDEYVLDEERNAFDAFMDQTHQTCKTYLHICNFSKTCKSFVLIIFIFLREKIISQTPCPRENKSTQKFFRPGHSRKLIHEKFFEVGIRENLSMRKLIHVR